MSRDDHLAATRAALADVIEAGRVELVVEDKDAFYRAWDGPPPALVFLDTDHSYEATAADIAWARAAGAAVIAGHDYDRTEHPGVVRAGDEAGRARQLVGTLWVL